MPRSTNFDDIKHLINVTASYMIAQNITEINGGHGKNSHFEKIAQLYSKGCFNEKAPFNLYVKWHRNDNNFKNKVLDMIRSKQDNENDSSDFKIIFDSKEWKTISKFISGNERQYLLCASNKFFSKKFEICGIRCQFKLKENRFCTTKRKLPGHFYWRGEFKCLLCKREINSFIGDNPKEEEKVILNLQIGNNICNGSIGKLRLESDEREKIKYEVFSKGVTNFKNDAAIIDKGDKMKLNITDSNLRKMRSQFVHRFKLDNDFKTDCDKAKFFFDFALPRFNKKSIEGYVQEIHSNPFGAILISEIQIKIWGVLSDREYVWYFDATGGIMKKVQSNQDTLLFSLVVHDSLNHKVIPIADFFTNSNNNVSIYGYLYKILEKFKCYKFFKYPKAVVTDYSWANLHALMKSFNNLDVIDYLNLTFQIIVNNQFFSISPIQTMIYLCSTHFLKNIVDDTKQVIKNDYNEETNDALNFFIDSFCFLQNTTCLNDFLTILKAMQIVFTSKTKNNFFLKCFATLYSYKMKTDIKMFIHTCKSCKNFKQENKNSSEEKKIFFIENQNISYVQDSPFTKYFNEHLNYIETNETNEKNKFYYPKLFEIVKKRLHIMPLWSGVFLKYVGLDETRLSNNYVEKWFQELKSNLLSKIKRSNKFNLFNPSELIIPIYFHLENIYSEIYQDHFNIKFADFEIKRNLYLNERLSYEKWNQNKAATNEKFSFPKFRFLKNPDTFKMIKTIKTIELSEINFINPFDFTDESKVEESNLIEMKEEQKIEDENSEIEIDNNEAPKNEDIYEMETNINNFFYYKINESLITKEDLVDLLNNRWLSDAVLNIFALCLLKNSKEKIVFIDSFYSTDIFNQGFIKVDIDFKFEKNKQVFGFINENKNHWTCFYVNFDNSTVYYLDPKGEKDANKEKFFKNWQKFCLSNNYLNGRKWKIGIKEHSIQTDSNNCGVYVCKFLELLLEQKSLIFYDSPNELKRFRSKMNFTFKKNSKQSFCSFCGSDLKIDDEIIKSKCFHRYHVNCPEVKIKSNLKFFCPVCF